jgi:hypothetical protein
MCALNSGTVAGCFVIATIFVNMSLTAVRGRSSFGNIFEVDFLHVFTNFG